MTGKSPRRSFSPHRPNQLDAVHTGHVDVRDQQIVVSGTECRPAVAAVNRDVHLVTLGLEQLPFDLANR